MLVIQLLLLLPLCYLSYKDIKALHIPAEITYLVLGALVVTDIALIIFGSGIEKQLALHDIIASAVITALIYLLYLLTKKSAFGEGDILIITAIALTSGVAGTLISIAFASWIGTFYAVYYYVKFHQFKGVKIPLVPFLTVGYAISIIVMKFVL